MSTSSSRDRGGTGGKACHRCGEEGHSFRQCPQKADSGGPSRTDISGGKPVDPTESLSPKPPQVRGRGEKKYYEGDEQKHASFARQEVRQSPKGDPPMEASETLNWGQPKEGESATKASETSNWDQPKHDSSVSANEPSNSAQSKDSFVTASETFDWTQPNDEASNWEQPYEQRAGKVNATAASISTALHRGDLASSPPQSKQNRLRSPQPRSHQKTRPDLLETSVSTPTIANTTPHLGQSGDSGFIRFAVMVSTPADLGDQREVVFVWPKEGYKNLRHRLGKVFDLDMEIGLAVKWGNDDPLFPDRTYLDEGNFEGVMALVGRRLGGDIIVVFRWTGDMAEETKWKGRGDGRLSWW